MYKHAEKFEKFLRGKKRILNWYNLKYFQMVYQGFCIILIGGISFGDSKSCSAPVQIFLHGLFGIYIFAFILNFIVFIVRSLKHHSQGIQNRAIKDLNLRVELCYFPLYWGFSILEFIWYVLGADWISQGNNCMDEYPNGLRLSQALVAFWVIVMFVLVAGFLAINFYLCSGKYNGAQSLEPEAMIDPRSNIRNFPETPKIIMPTIPQTPAKEYDD
jgi:hypothetical protein